MSPALHAKDIGNKLYKDGKLTESLKFYKEAEKLDPKSPVYPSNSSAALYELGDYASCFESILRSWALGPTDSMAMKLSTRLAKALSQGVQNGTINPSVIEQNEATIKELEKLASTENSDVAQAWSIWKNIKRGLGHHIDLVHEAEVRFSKLPIYKPMLWVPLLSPNIVMQFTQANREPEELYFVFGIEPVVSLASGFGPDNDEALNTRALPNESLSQLSFMLAGIGDGRHGFGTIIGLGQQFDKLNAPRQKAFKAHITINDIHFGIVARNFMFYLLLDELMADYLDPITRVEIQASLFYMYAGWIVPTYVHKRFVKLCEDAEDRLTADPPRLPSWLHVDVNAIRPIAEVIHFWYTDTTKKTTDVLNHLKYVSASDHIQSLLSSGMMGVREAMQSQRDDAERSLKTIPDDALRTLGGTMRWRETSIPELRKKVGEEKEEVIDILLMAQFDKNIELGLFPEAEWFRRTLTFIPPPELMERHPGFEYYHKSFGAIGAKAEIDDSKYKKLKVITTKTWKPNITIFSRPDGRCVDMSLDSFGCVQEIARFSEQKGLKDMNKGRKTASPAFSYLVTFFEATVAAAKAMKDHLRIEFMGGEINAQLSKISLGVDRRPAEFPRKFTRIWLSNIPDYRHGSLNTIIYALPLLQDDIEGSGVTANCQFNSPTWTSDEEFCYNYTLLLPRDLERYLGVRTLNGKAVQDSLTLGAVPHPLPLTSLASREQLHSWLSRLLLALIYPGKAKPRPNTVKLPDNLVAFIKLLYELRHIGYPSHWLSDFLHAVLNGTLQVDHPVYREETPRPISDIYKRVAPYHARLDPWYAELEMILASTWHCLPFATQFPDGFATSADEVGVFKANPVTNMQYMTMLSFPRNDSVFCLLFYKPMESGLQSDNSLQSFLSDLPSVIGGQARPPPGTFHIFTTLESLDLNVPVVHWKMSKKLAAKMRRERWVSVLWRTDFYVVVTLPCHASTWTAVDLPI